MRINTNVKGALSGLTSIVTDIGERFGSIMGDALVTSTTQVMLGDATVTTQESFDLEKLKGILNSIVDGVDEWDSEGVSVTNNEDTRRVFVKLHARVGGYIMTCHLSVQFHVLLYYRPVQQVIDCQKELSRIMDASKAGEEELAMISNKLIAERLKSAGHDTLDEQELFEMLYKDDTLRASLEDDIEGEKSHTLHLMAERKKQLFSELDSLLIETYSTTSVPIDDARLVTGEEGHLYTMDIEYYRGAKRLSIPKRISHNRIEEMIRLLNQLHDAMKHATIPDGQNMT